MNLALFTLRTAKRLLIGPDRMAIAANTLRYCQYRLSASTLPIADSAESALIGELRSEIQNLPPIDNHTGSKAADEWANNRIKLRDMISNDDPRRFLSWDVIHRTMYVNDANFLAVELDELTSQPNWPNRWKSVLQESNVGTPQRYAKFPVTSGNQIHHAYHLAKFEKSTGTTLPTVDFVIEFGGGYGNLCRTAFRAGFSGKYVIFDLPEFSALQRYFLKSHGITVCQTMDELSRLPGPGVCCISNIDEIAQTNICSNNGVFIATWSISETENSLRKKILAMPMINNIPNWLIAYQASFGEVNNEDFFNEITRTDNTNWINFEISHLPKNYYLFGRKKSSVASDSPNTCPTSLH